MKNKVLSFIALLLLTFNCAAQTPLEASAVWKVTQWRGNGDEHPVQLSASDVGVNVRVKEACSMLDFTVEANFDDFGTHEFRHIDKVWIGSKREEAKLIFESLAGYNEVDHRVSITEEDEGKKIVIEELNLKQFRSHVDLDNGANAYIWIMCYYDDVSIAGDGILEAEKKLTIDYRDCCAKPEVASVGVYGEEGSMVEDKENTFCLFSNLYVSATKGSAKNSKNLQYLEDLRVYMDGELLSSSDEPEIKVAMDQEGDLGQHEVTLKFVYPGDVCGTSHINIKESDPTSFDVEVCKTEKCDSCLTSFEPTPCEKYVMSAWVSEENMDQVQFEDPVITLRCKGSGTVLRFKSSGPVVEGWQRIEEPFVLPCKCDALTLELGNEGVADVFFDDIRIFPFGASMTSYAYEQETGRLLATLDDSNYATYYEYDLEGNLIRVKAETEEGIITLKESHFNTSRKN